jgi:hypothetical protein
MNLSRRQPIERSRRVPTGLPDESQHECHVGETFNRSRTSNMLARNSR